LTFTTGGGRVTVEPMNGAPAQQLTTGDVIRVNWSPDGKRVLVVTRANVIETLPAAGGPSVELFRPPRNQLVFDALELPDGSILMAMMPPGSAQVSTPEAEIWKLRPDEIGVAGETPRRLTWAATASGRLSASTAGNRVVFLTTQFQRDLYMADADFHSGVLTPPQRFTQSDRDDSVFAWTPDSSAVFLESNRNGTTDIFKQRVNSDIAEPFVTGSRSQGSPAVTNDGNWVLYTDGTYTEHTVMRLSLTGGAPAELVHQVGTARLHCALHGRCVLRELKDGSFIVSSLDPLAGRGAELARTSETYGFDLLPDGDAFAYILPPTNGVRNCVRVISFTGKAPWNILVKGATRLQGIGWLPTNSGFLATDGGRLLLVSINGASNVLWAPTLVSVGWAVASPDERHVAISVSSIQANAWMLSDF